jgi:hypothetical protein
MSSAAWRATRRISARKAGRALAGICSSVSKLATQSKLWSGKGSSMPLPMT